MERNKKIIWAVDPFVNERQLQASTAWAVRALTQESGASIEPVYVLDEYPIGVAIETPLEITEQARDAGQDELDRLLTRVKLENLKPLRVLAGPSTGQKGIAETLISYAKEAKADMIVLSTHARKGIERWFMGSFAETLMMSSEIPLLIVNPSWESVTDFRHVLFPTDFSEESNSVFDQAIEFAKGLHADITVFHHIPSVLHPILRAAMLRRPAYREALEERIRASQAEANRLAEKARASGLEAHTFIDCELIGATADAILRQMERKNYLVAMSARSGRFAKGLSGITTRGVIRRAVFPVLVLHPEETEVFSRAV